MSKINNNTISQEVVNIVRTVKDYNEMIHNAFMDDTFELMPVDAYLEQINVLYEKEILPKLVKLSIKDLENAHIMTQLLDRGMVVSRFEEDVQEMIKIKTIIKVGKAFSFNKFYRIIGSKDEAATQYYNEKIASLIEQLKPESLPKLTNLIMEEKCNTSIIYLILNKARSIMSSLEENKSKSL